MLPNAWIIAKKEIRLLFKSTRRIFLLFTTPLILLVIFGIMIIISITMYSIEGEKIIEIGVIQVDEGYNGRNWGEQFYSLLRSYNTTKDYLYTNESIDSLNTPENFTILLYIPANFSSTINQSIPAQIFLFYDNSKLENQGIIANITVVAQILNQQILYDDYGPITINRVFMQPKGTSSESGFEQMIASFVTMIPLYAIIFLVIPSLSLVLISVTIEREQKTLESLILQPIERKSIITGKLLYGAILVGVNTLLTGTSIIVILLLTLIILPEDLKTELDPIISEIGSIDLSTGLFLLFIVVGLVLVSFLTITAAVLFSLMANDEREANMVVSALVLIPIITTLLIAFLPIGDIHESIQVILVILPLLGYLFAIYLILVSGEMPLFSILSLLAQLAWTILGIWFTGRLIESEGILEISYKRWFLLRRK